MSYFHITYTHTPEVCPGEPNSDPEKINALAKIYDNSKENNVKLHFFVANPTEHKMYLLLETDEYINIEKTIGHTKKLGSISITPVVDFQTMKELNSP